MFLFIYFSSDSLTLHKLLSCQSHIQTNTQIDKQLFMFFYYPLYNPALPFMVFLLTEKPFIKDVLYPEEPLATRQLLGGPDQWVAPEG